MLRNEAPAQTALTKPKTGVQARLVRSVGRYEVYGEIATGGMATVHIGKLRGAAGLASALVAAAGAPSLVALLGFLVVVAAPF